MGRHGGGLLDRPEDTPSEQEEKAINRIRTRREDKLREIDLAISRAHHRQQVALAAGNMEAASVEGGVKDRRLDERLTVMAR